MKTLSKLIALLLITFSMFPGITQAQDSKHDSKISLSFESNYKINDLHYSGPKPESQQLFFAGWLNLDSPLEQKTLTVNLSSLETVETFIKKSKEATFKGHYNDSITASEYVIFIKAESDWRLLTNWIPRLDSHIAVSEEVKKLGGMYHPYKPETGGEFNIFKLKDGKLEHCVSFTGLKWIAFWPGASPYLECIKEGLLASCELPCTGN